MDSVTYKLHLEAVSLILLGSACLHGQPVTQEARELTLTWTGDAGPPTFHVRNQYSAAATAWVVECHGNRSQWHWSDQELGLEGKPIEPGKENEFKLPTGAPMMLDTCSRRRNTCARTFRVIAAVFADGTVSGDLRWIEAIVRERRKAYKDIAKSTDILNHTVAEGTDQSKVVQQLTEWKNQEVPNDGTDSVFANYGETNFWGGSTSGSTSGPPPAGRPLTRDAVPGATLWLLQEKGKSVREANQLLAEWKDRLGQLKAVTEAGDTGGPMPFRAPQPDLVG